MYICLFIGLSAHATVCQCALYNYYTLPIRFGNIEKLRWCARMCLFISILYLYMTAWSGLVMCEKTTCGRLRRGKQKKSRVTNVTE